MSFLFSFFFFFNDTATTEIYTLSLHDALPIPRRRDDPGKAILVTPLQAVDDDDRDLDEWRGLAKRRTGQVRDRPAGRERQALGPLVLGRCARDTGRPGQQRGEEDRQSPRRSHAH